MTTTSVSAGHSDSGILDELPVAYLELNAEGWIIRANRTANSLFPHEHGDLVGKSAWDIMAPDSKEWSRALFFKIMETGEIPPPIRSSLYTSSGEFRSFEVHRTLSWSAQGKPAGVRMVCFDVTEMEREQENAHRAKVWLENVLESVSDAVIVSDVLGFVRTVNPAAEKLLGWKAAEFQGRVIERRVPLLSYASGEGGAFCHRIALERRTRGIATTLDRDRNELRVEISTSPMVDKECDAVAGVVTVLRRVEPVPVPAPPCDTAAV